MRSLELELRKQTEFVDILSQENVHFGNFIIYLERKIKHLASIEDESNDLYKQIKNKELEIIKVKADFSYEI